MAGRPAVYAAAHAVEPFIQKVAQAPARAVARQAVQVVNVVVPFPMGGAFPCGIDLVQPIVGDHLASGVVDQPGIGICGVGVGGDAPVALADVFLHRQLAVHIRIAGIQAGNLFALHLVQEAVGDESLGGFKISAAEQSPFNQVLDFLHGCVVLVAQLGLHLFINGAVVNSAGTVERLFNGFLDLVALIWFLLSGTFDDACRHGDVSLERMMTAHPRAWHKPGKS